MKQLHKNDVDTLTVIGLGIFIFLIVFLIYMEQMVTKIYDETKACHIEQVRMMLDMDEAIQSKRSNKEGKWLEQQKRFDQGSFVDAGLSDKRRGKGRRRND